MASEQFYSPQELAEYLDYPLATIRKWRTEGTGPVGIRIGKRLRYRKSEVERWLQSRESERSDQNGNR